MMSRRALRFIRRNCPFTALLAAALAIAELVMWLIPATRPLAVHLMYGVRLALTREHWRE